MLTTRSRITCLEPPLSDIDTDLLACPVHEQDDLADLAELDRAAGGELSAAFEAKEFRGKPFELLLVPFADRRWRARRVAAVGAGPREPFTTERLRKVAATAALAARQRRVRRLAFVIRPGLDAEEAAQAIAEGLTLAELDLSPYKTTDADRPPPLELQVVGPPGAVRPLQARIDRGRLLGECTNLARSLGNEPANVLTPRALAERADQIVTEAGIALEVLDEEAMAQLGMGLLLGVARGSAEPPRLIVMRYQPADVPSDSPLLGLLGKGITFDTGGISIKPAEGMERMKDDMVGGAAVIAAMRAIGMLRPSIPVVGIVPASENMPGGRALKPGDVLRSASGKTVEVVNTDAEGRLVLGDALWYARRLGATHLVDIATLTGACMVALGKITSGLFGAPDAWVEVVRGVAERAGDRAWPLPVFDEYAEQLRSEVADLVNSAGRPAGAITAAMFLKEFAGGLPWAHLDIAGTAWNDESKPYLAKGPTGVGVRTLAELPLTYQRW